MAVKRYEMNHKGLPEHDANGSFVLWQDHAELQRQLTASEATVTNLTARVQGLAAENELVKQRMSQLIQIISNADNNYCMCGDEMKIHAHGGCGHPTGMFDYHYNQWLESSKETPITDAALAEIRAQGVDGAIQTIITHMNHQHGAVKAALDILKTYADTLRKEQGK